ncbi:MAG: hypothetical protein KIT31_33910 [Deltaproteobacteria bacterium]|nr:hypothetical protein [Deltaproteobacteria bacterium]
MPTGFAAQAASLRGEPPTLPRQRAQLAVTSPPASLERSLARDPAAPRAIIYRSSWRSSSIDDRSSIALRSLVESPSIVYRSPSARRSSVLAGARRSMTDRSSIIDHRSSIIDHRSLVHCSSIARRSSLARPLLVDRSSLVTRSPTAPRSLVARSPPARRLVDRPSAARRSLASRRSSTENAPPRTRAKFRERSTGCVRAAAEHRADRASEFRTRASAFRKLRLGDRRRAMGMHVARRAVRA